jgi:hypothetical protein
MHSHQKFRNAGRARVAHILASGGCAKPAHKKTGGSAGMRFKHAAPDEPEMATEGTKRGKRHAYARGGKLKSPKITVNIHKHAPIIAGGPGMPAGGPAMAAGPMPPGGTPPMPPPGMAQGLPPGLPAGPMPVRARGGHIPDHHYLAGAGTGVGRVQAFHDQKRREG